MENTIEWDNKLPKKIMLLNRVVMILITWFIYNAVDGVLYLIIYFVIALVAIPGFTYLARTSLRAANKDIIPADKPIKITIENLVKIYDRPSLLEREWEGGINLRKRLIPDSIWHNTYVQMIPSVVVPLFFFWRNDLRSCWLTSFSFSFFVWILRKISSYVYDILFE